VLSASVRQSDRDEADDAGADAFLAKPYRPPDLIALVQEMTATLT
jgi:CheY-like chemotaxis protein